jgi:hypothetical protein
MTTLNAIVPSVGTGTWSVVSGSGTFASPNAANSQVSGLAPGPNIFRWTISNGSCPVTMDDVLVIRDASSTPANAGPDQTVFSPSATLAGNSPVTGFGFWMLVSGSGFITSPNDPNTTVTGLGLGVNTFQWTLTGGFCPQTSDQVDITYLQNGVQLSIKAFLQGPFSSASLSMHDSLRVKGLIPLAEPYSAQAGFTHVGGGGSESLNPMTLGISGNNAIVDWVFVELRDKNDSTLVVATRSALIQRDGDVVDVDGFSPVLFGGLSNDAYYVALRHRNHLGIMSSTTLNLTTLPTVIDFTTGITAAFGNNAMAYGPLTGFAYLMWGGDTNSDGEISISGGANDSFGIFTLVFFDPGNVSVSQLYVVNGYYKEDCNMDGKVKLTGVGNDPFVINLNIFTHPQNTSFSNLFGIHGQLP